MKKPILLWFGVAVWLVATASASAAGDGVAIAEVTAADAERVAAVVAADRERLEAILSDELRYAHSNGKVDTKAVLIETLVSERTDYESFEYLERAFTPVGDGAMTMAGRVIIGLRNADGQQKIDLNYLAVWRREKGTWRFLAWQSARNPMPVPEPPLPPAPSRPASQGGSSQLKGPSSSETSTTRGS